MGFSRQDDWSGLPCPSPGDLPHPGIEPGSPALQADSSLSEPQGSASVEGGDVPAMLCGKIQLASADHEGGGSMSQGMQTASGS